MPKKGRGELQIIMEHATAERSVDNLQMWACRNNLPTCAEHLRKGKHCDSCVLGDDNDTIGQLVARLDRGDA